MKIEVGMSVVVVMRDSREPVTEQIVQSVGRKWVYLPRGRFNKTTMFLDGEVGCRQGAVYLTMEDYRYELARNEQLRNLKYLVERAIKPSVTLSDIEQAIKLLSGSDQPDKR